MAEREYTVQMNGMIELTKRQRQILGYIQECQRAGGMAPSLREIAGHFGFSSMTSAMDHVRLLRKKGVLENQPGRARSLRVVSPLEKFRSKVADIPLYGAIPAGLPEDRQQEPKGCVSIDIETLGFKPTTRTFALEVRGDSMIGKYIMNGDVVILEHGMPPRNGDVVAALIDNESTLKTFLVSRGKPFLRAENPRYPDLIPAQELVIQGVMVGLVRKCK
jgi:repressor LexA